MLQPTEHNHIVVDDEGRALIAGTRFKVRELVKAHLAYGWSPEELQWQYPDVTLAQVYAALAYYYDHESAFNAEIQEGLAQFERLRAENLDSPVRRKLKALGRI